MRLIFKLGMFCAFGLGCNVTAHAGEPELKLEDCEKADRDDGPIGRSACLSNNNIAMKEHVDRLADRAIAYMTSRENFDGNEFRSPEYLRKSQAAWWEYAQSTCIVVAGQVGGAPQWVGREYDECLRRTLEKRIRFLDLLLSEELDIFASGYKGEGI